MYMELKTQLQKRVAYQPSGLLVREEGEQPKTLEGVAIVVNAETVLYEDSEVREIEVIDPSCIIPDFIAGQDIKLNLLHERSLSFARNGAQGTLSLTTEEDGLHFSTPVPDCDLGKRALALVGNGTYTGCSFEFWPQDYTVEQRTGADGKEEYVIRHTQFARIGAITIGMDPAYQQTSVNARELYREQHPATTEPEPIDTPQPTAGDEEEREREMARRIASVQAAFDAEDAINDRNF